MAILERSFYARNTLEVAKSLLGNLLFRRTDEGIVMCGKIVETEAYTQDDPSCHAFRGVTNRSKTLFMNPGTAYIYFTYGMHHCLNFVTEREGFGSGVLIRALEPLSNLTDTNGPGKLTRQLGITRELNETDITDGKSPFWVEKGEELSDENIVQTTRIGIKQGTELPWRFYIKDNKWVSKKT